MNLKFRLPSLRQNHVLTGGALLMISTTIVNGGNYLFNLILGRWLGPAAFADLSLIVTLMLMVTFITVTFQLTAARFTAVYMAAEDIGRLKALRRWLGRVAWGTGGLLALVLGGGALFWMQFFHTASYWPFVILAVGMPVYFAQGVDRGILQGQTRFGMLSLSYQAEMWVRLVAAIGLVAVGLSVNGAVAGLTLSFVATWLVARRVGVSLKGVGGETAVDHRAIMTFAMPVIVAHLSQILINNSDILIVKRFFAAEPAGQYAALALIGRIVFFATWSVVTVLFPIVAQKHEKKEPHRHLLFISLMLVGLISGFILLLSLFVPEIIVQLLFGKAYLSVSPLLWLYALATALYAMANVVVNYHLSIGNGHGTVITLFAGMAQVLGLWFFHATLKQVVVAQIYIMATLLIILLMWDFWISVIAKRTIALKQANVQL